MEQEALHEATIEDINKDLENLTGGRWKRTRFDVVTTPTSSPSALAFVSQTPKRLDKFPTPTSEVMFS
jgi:uracil-DNA glycosylase